MARIYWKSTWASDHPRVEGRSTVPKRPVIWRGNVWMRFTEGDRIVTDKREWQAPFPIKRKDAQHILSALLAELMALYRDVDQCDMGFELVSP